MLETNLIKKAFLFLLSWYNIESNRLFSENNRIIYLLVEKMLLSYHKNNCSGNDLFYLTCI